MYEELLGFIKSVKNPYLNRLLSSFFVDDAAFAKAFQFHSAAKTVHHGFVGGLLEHTLSVTKLCDYYAGYIFMNQETFDQIPIAHDLINGVDFLLEGMVVDVVSDASTETVLFADVPVKVQMKITYTEPGLKGDTATNTLKPATVESGATVRVPLFINEGETIEIDTRDGSYVGRVKA